MIGDLVLAVRSDSGAYRLVFALDDGFVVYKAFKFNDLWTVKYWKGLSVKAASRRWTTDTPFDPTEWMVERARERILHATLRMTDLFVQSSSASTPNFVKEEDD